jgi:hypothetical protein
VFNPAPILVVRDSLNVVIDAGADGSLFADIPAGRIVCAFEALEESVTALGTMTTTATDNLSAQGKFATAITGGFSS